MNMSHQHNALKHVRYKNIGNDAQMMRRRREEEGIQLRREKRDEQMNKRRNLDGGACSVMPVDSFCNSASDVINTELLEAINTNNIVDQLESTKTIRELLSSASNPPIAIEEVV